MTELNDINGKLVILGDKWTGKTSLLSNLASLNNINNQNENNLVNNSYTIQFNSSEFEYKIDKPVFIKTWEYPSDENTITDHEKVLSLRCVLFCVITIDLRSPETAYNAFNKWINIYDEYMNESFLFVVGTYLDHSVSRKVEVLELCKACSARKAVYIEISNNSNDKTNLKLFRKLLSQRIDYMLKIRDKVMEDLNEISNDDPHDTNTDDTPENYHNFLSNDDITKLKNEYMNYDASKLHTPFLEPEIMYTSTGSILSSIIGIKDWPGIENIPDDFNEEFNMNESAIENTLVNIRKFRTNVEEYLKKLETNDHVDEDFIGDMHIADDIFQVQNENNSNDDIDIKDLQELFQMIGFDPSIYPPVKPLSNPLPQSPPSITSPVSASVTSSIPQSTNVNPLTTNFSTLNNNKQPFVSTNLSSNTQENINPPNSNNINTTKSDKDKDNLNRRSLKKIEKSSPGLSIDSAVDSHTNSSVNSLLSANNNINNNVNINNNNFMSKKKLKIRIQLPNNLVTNSIADNTADIRINKGDNILQIITEIGEKYKLTSDQRQKILVQLVNSCT